MITKNDIIIDFIQTFSGFHAKVIDNQYHKIGGSEYTLDSPIIECFTQGCCYWFAFILKERFSGKIVFDPIVHHFACSIDDVVYDITGECNSTYGPDLMHWVDWDTYEIKEDGTPSGTRMEIINNCIKKYNEDLNKEYLNCGGTLI